MEDSFYEALEHIFNEFPKYHMKILLGNFSVKVGREGSQTVNNESLHKISHDDKVRVVKSATSKNIIVKDVMFPHCSVHKYTWTSPDGNMHNQIDCVLIDKRWHSSRADDDSSRGADCGIGGCRN